MIGIFDSGAGGLSVWKELIRLAPLENYLYLSDAAYCPYGPKSKEEVVVRSCKIADYLIGRGASLIVVACNTATAAAIEELRQRYAVPFVGMEPAVKPAAIETRSGVIGVLATKGTFKGSLYINTSHKYAKEKDIKVIETVGEGLVELVESGNTEGSEAERLIAKYLNPMIEAGADHVVLGCTHYPFLEPLMRKIAGDRLKIINPAPAVASHALNILKSVQQKKCNNLVSKTGGSAGSTIIATTGCKPKVLEQLAASVVQQLKRENPQFDHKFYLHKSDKLLNLNKE